MGWNDGLTRPVTLAELGQRYRHYRLADPDAEEAMAGSLRRWGHVAHFWIAPAPCWDCHAASLLDALCRLGRRVVCHAAAAACCTWNDATFPDKVAETWEGVRHFIAEQYLPRPDLDVARNDLRREAMMVSMQKMSSIPKLQTPSVDGWLADSIAAFEALPAGCFANLSLAERVHLLAKGPQKTVQPADEVTPTEPSSAIKLIEPTKPAFAAYRAYWLGGKTQIEIAQILTEDLRRPISQGQVSRWIGEVATWMKAGNALPDLPGINRQPPPMDPSKIDLGERQDGRTRRQREDFED